ncbi:MAG: hypothetical protein HYS73_01570 [Parcubacteria group bacterium]|nr:hypothetical protein [Parcubacteria group bacterium]
MSHSASSSYRQRGSNPIFTASVHKDPAPAANTRPHGDRQSSERRRKGKPSGGHRRGGERMRGKPNL